MFIGGMILVVALALHIAWIAKLAEARGRSLILWIAIGIVAGAIGARVGIAIMSAAIEAEIDTVSLIGGLAPLPMLMLPMIAVALVLQRLPVMVELHRVWPVHSPKHGSGRLEIARDKLLFHWEARRDEIRRSEVKMAKVDGECLRLGWTAGELVVMPMGSPQTRAGRIKQSETLAQILTPAEPG